MKSQISNILKVLMINSSKIIKKILTRAAIAIGILLFILMLKAINTKPTNRLLNTFKSTMDYEFSIVDDSKRIFNKAKDLLDNSPEVLEVFNLGEASKHPAPLYGKLHKGFNKDTNKGIDIKSDGEFEPRAISGGIVTDLILTDSKGYYVTIESEEFQYTYGYLSKSYVTIGDKVVQGDSIGYLGTNKDGNRYLRFEVVKDGKVVNPENYIELH